MLICPECGASYPDTRSDCEVDGCALVPAEGDPQLAPGTMVGEYRVDRKLGSGTFGAVYAGEQPLIGKRVAIKVLHRQFSAETAIVSRFVAEARAVNRIRHRNIIDVFSFGLLGEKREGRLGGDGQHYFVMELLDGLTLGELLAREGRLSVARALPILRGMAEGLDAAHAAGVTHRDLKPDNVFLATERDGSYFPKLLDFGVAKLVAEDLAHKTATGVAMGTPLYMSPEQSRGKNVDHRTDIYALGVVTHLMLTGRPPFDGDSVVEVLFKHATDPPPPMSSVCPDLPPALDAPVLAMVAKRPSARPDSAGKAVAALIEAASKVGFDREGAQRMSPPETAAGPAQVATVAVQRPPKVSPDAPTVAVEVTRKQEGDPKLAPGAPTVAVGARPAASAETQEVGPQRAGGERIVETVRSAGTDGPPAETVVDPGEPLPGEARAAQTSAPEGNETLYAAPLHAAPGVPPSTEGQSASGPGRTVIAGVPASAPPGERPSGTRAGRRLGALTLAGAGLALGGLVLARGAREPSSASVPPANEAVTAGVSTLPSRATRGEGAPVTLRVAAEPPDAVLLLEDRRVGLASAPLVLSRSEARRALRVEREGYAPQTFWIVPDRDQDLSVALTPLAGTAPLASAASAAPQGEAKPRGTARPQLHRDLDLPAELAPVGTKRTP
ncbi:serine/threonine-protein kinase [Chondromyces apiculatus]|uniref:non-specific serine/threonine protein kinase n=1 Tax=Chondromyces apiculatus DSM 436 TaxID=1192034 RepID=A0A017T8E3_9BACT|nr:serine/threonine-protein kinase [Chondromyces apiculatus]EYF05045.1 serine/threonine protein kinase [Chondromyces apiculatus DSM 436]